MMLPARNMVGGKRALRILDRSLGAVRVRTGGIGQYQRVLAFLVTEEEEDPLMLHQSGDEIKSGLAKLNAILAIGRLPNILHPPICGTNCRQDNCPALLPGGQG